MKDLLNPQPKMCDLIDAEVVEVLIDSTGKLWVNVDGLCKLRIGHADSIKVEHHKRRK